MNIFFEKVIFFAIFSPKNNKIKVFGFFTICQPFIFNSLYFKIPGKVCLMIVNSIMDKSKFCKILAFYPVIFFEKKSNFYLKKNRIFIYFSEKNYFETFQKANIIQNMFTIVLKMIFDVETIIRLKT